MTSLRPNRILVAGSDPSTALHDLRLIPISRVDAKKLIVRILKFVNQPSKFVRGNFINLIQVGTGRLYVY
jgi:hypothetical protein